MPWVEFCFRLILALILGCVIGFERQWRQRTAGMRTNTLVALGSVLFVLMGMMSQGEASSARVAAAVATGIGFLGAGVIIREGLSVRGLNTAATLWCSAAVGALCGAGSKIQALVGTVAVLATNILLRPIAQRFLRLSASAAESETNYRLIAVCRAEDEQKMRALLMQMVNTSSLKIHSLLSEDADNPAKVEISARMAGTGTDHTAMEHLVSRLSLEAGVSAVSWEIVTQEEI